MRLEERVHGFVYFLGVCVSLALEMDHGAGTEYLVPLGLHPAPLSQQETCSCLGLAQGG